jgi:hypothetical protein
MKAMMKSVMIVGLVCLAVPAFAKGKKAAAKSHCMKDGAEVAEATSKKACKKAGGKWEKMAAGDEGGAAPAPAPAPEGGAPATP